MKRILLIFFAFLQITILQAESAVEKRSKEADWKGIMRVKGLQSLDKVLALAFDAASRSYVLKVDFSTLTFKCELDELQVFAKNFGYFSPNHPLIGKVTGRPDDVLITQEILHYIHQHIQEPQHREIAFIEVMTKILAYRDLSEGQEIELPLFKNPDIAVLAAYKVDKIFDLWRGMPAIGLVPKLGNKNYPPILLYRGTDLSLSTERGWASVMSDVNTGGPGISVFKKSQPMIREWLQAQAKKGAKAQVMGFSLGGVLALYTVIFEKSWVNTDPQYLSTALNTPGIARKIIAMSKEHYPKGDLPIKIWITKGDLVSKIGFLVGNVYELSAKRMLKPIAAHVSLMSALSQFSVSQVDVDRENASRGY